MPVRVLIVDDSGFFRHRINDLLDGDTRIQVVGSAQNGREAVEQAKLLKPDLITMDVEMPQMNGIEAVRIIMRESPTNILMLSSLTHEGAQVTLQALEAGALDYLSKDMRAWMDHSASLEKQLRDKVVELGRSRHALNRRFFSPSTKSPADSKSMVFRSATNTAERKMDTKPKVEARPLAKREPLNKLTAERQRKTVDTLSSQRPASHLTNNISSNKPEPERKAPGNFSARKGVPDKCRLVVIGSSTGGPAALQHILTQLPASFPHPIMLVQHMPKTFTSVFASRLDQQCNIAVKEAEDGDRLIPGQALLAPGGLQMIIDARQKDRIRIMPSDERLTYKPSVDVSYASAAKTYGNQVLGIILTGMGADGCDGAKMLKQANATIWAQNKESSTIYGMPQAVVNAGLADQILDLSEFGPLLSKATRAR